MMDVPLVLPVSALDIPFSVSVLTATRGNASKALIAGAHGLPIKGTGDLGITRGQIEHVEVQGLAGLQALLAGIDKKQALVHGIITGSRPGDVHPIVPDRDLARATPDTRARTKACITYPDGIHLLMLDRDDNPQDHTKLQTVEELIALLTPLFPGIARAGRVVTVSTSSAIRSKATKEWLVPPRGFHIYLLVRGTLPRFVDLLKVRLWNAGYGYCCLVSPNTRTGVASVLERTCIDLAVYSAERLDYVAGARIAKHEPFYQDRGVPTLVPGDVLELDTFPDLTPEERQDYQRRLAEAKAQIAPERFRLVKEVVEHDEPTLTPPQVETIVRQRLEHIDGGWLAPDFLLEFDHRTTAVPVSALSAKYDGKRLADPAEPDYRDGADAVFHWHQGNWCINSFAHGLLHTYRPLPIPPPDSDEEDMQGLVRQAASEAYDHQNGHTPGGAWTQQLLCTEHGIPQQTINNFVLALHHLEPWKSAGCWYDVVRERHMVGTTPLQDGDDITAGVVIERATRIRVSNIALVGRALDYTCRRTTRDLLHEWVTNLPRAPVTDLLTTWFRTYAHVPDEVPDAYVADLSRVLPVSMIARIEQPGCQYRNVIILEGDEDVGKSKLTKALAGTDPFGHSWHVALSAALEGKEGLMMLEGALIAELEELSSYGKTEENRMKALVTAQTDSFVPKYSNRRADHPRRTIFIATVNPEGGGDYLKGQTGNTRWLPLKVGLIDIDGFLTIRERLFAEAKTYYQTHPKDWWKLDCEVDAANEREARRQASVYEGPTLRAWLRGRQRCRWDEVAEECFEIPTDRWNRALQMEIGKALRASQWQPGHAGTERYWEPV
jgi:hypothetical protein